APMTTRLEVRKAIIPAAGLGTRFLPATKASPKEMLNVVDKPVIQYGVEEAVDSGLDTVVLVTAARKTIMEDHFDYAPDLERALEAKGRTADRDEMRRIADLANVVYVRQKEARGLGHAVLCARPVVGDQPFAVFLPDDIIDAGDDPVMAQLLRIYAEKRRPVVAVERVPRQDVTKYGILAVEDVAPRLFRIKDMVEKPSVTDAPSELAIMGRYVLTPDIWDALETTRPGAGGEIQLTDGIKALLARGGVYAYEYVGRRYDCGSKLGYLRATVELALSRADLGPDFRAYLIDLLSERQWRAA
ncbi:MAG TPA: UTP--glucose-1-phosphate uridylyltransferase GalU, partial [Chloroflexota bacterium]|nr:UTP--glucose-1-phosphate uridylyltransferase GalU [Chloroflexota bacterium]